jgi:hypothetical protein
MKKSLLLFMGGILSFLSFSQNTYLESFDGDTLMTYEDTLDISIDTVYGKTWQIGPPQKIVFDQALSLPNVIVTDTIGLYPNSDSSFFVASFVSDDYAQILAFKWSQKLDMDSLVDGGTIQFQINSEPWQNIDQNWDVYDHYGHASGNWDSIASNDNKIGYTGVDSTWRQIWLCWSVDGMLDYGDTVNVKFQIHSDTIQNNQEGWMIDDISVHYSYLHTIYEQSGLEYFTIFPNPSSDKIIIDQAKQNGFDMIDEVIIYNLMGREKKRFNDVPAHFTIDISDLPKGPYVVQINSEKYGESTHKIIRK